MRTFLAFKSKENLDEEDYVKKIDKVKTYYESQFLKYDLLVEKHLYKNIGAFILDSQQNSLNFPSKIMKDDQSILTFFPPISVAEENINFNEKLFNLSNKLNNDNQYLNNLPSPFLFCTIDEHKEELSIYPDMMGINRLYKLENENGVYWSNRPAALLIFADERAKIDIKSWKIYSVTGWFMNKKTPFEKIERVEHSVIFKAKCNDKKLYYKINTNGLEYLITLNSEQNISTNDIAFDMINNLKNFQSFWNIKMQVDISGGQDSRVSAASVIRSDIQNFYFRSITDIDAEVNTAKHLLETIENSHDFKIVNPAINMVNCPDLLERVDRLLFEFDGDFATVMMNSPIIESNKFIDLDKTFLNGFGGEISKGAFYASQKWIDKLISKGENAAFYRLSTHLSKLGNIDDESIKLMEEELSIILNKSREYNFTGLKQLDFFYFHERIRRWSPLGDIVHSYSPFLSKYFISAGLNACPIDNMNVILHKEIIDTLIPEWRNIDFFKATPEQSKEKDKKNLRIWQTSDKNQVERILNNSESWNDSFLEKDIVKLWEKAKEQGIPNYQETIFQRVVLRARFNEHLIRINAVIDKIS